MTNIARISSALIDKLEDHLLTCEHSNRSPDAEYSNIILKEASIRENGTCASAERDYIAILESVRFIEKQKATALNGQMNRLSTSLPPLSSPLNTKQVIISAISILKSANPYIHFVNRLERQRDCDNNPGLTLAIVDICQGRGHKMQQRELFYTASAYGDALILNKNIPIIIPNIKTIQITNSSQINESCPEAFAAITSSIINAVENVQPSLCFK